MPTAGKVMLAMFWDFEGVLLVHFQKRGENVNSASYCEVPLKLWGAIHKKTYVLYPFVTHFLTLPCKLLFLVISLNTP
jgi:hypothetical protein